MKGFDYNENNIRIPEPAQNIRLCFCFSAFIYEKIIQKSYIYTFNIVKNTKIHK